jgi:hypothetical protein
VAAQCFTLHIYVHYPETQLQKRNAALFIRGNGLGLSWNQGRRMQKVQDSLYSYDVTFTTKDVNQTLEIKALLDDQVWQIGSNSKLFLAYNGNSEYRADVYPWFDKSQGSLDYIRSLYSPQLKNSRDVIMFLPASFYENHLKPIENVLVMHDGQNLFDPNTAFMHNAWMAQDSVNQLVLEGKMEEVLIVGVYNTPDRIDELTYSVDESEHAGGKADLYLDFIQETVLPRVKSKYSDHQMVLEQENLGILGSSLGGLCSCYAAWTRTTYSRAGL